MKTIGMEITGILIKSKMLALGEIVYIGKKKERKLYIKLDSIQIQVGCIFPSVIPPILNNNKSYYFTAKTLKLENINVTVNKLNLNTNDHFGTLFAKPETINMLKNIYSQGFCIDLINAKTLITFLEKLILKNADNISQMQILIMSDILDINLLTIKKNVSKKTWKELLTYILDFTAKKKKSLKLIL